MSSLAEFLKGTVSDSLAKVLQPSGLLPGALLVLLNLAFVYPAARAEEVPVAISYAGLASGWQAVVLGTLVLGIGFLLLSASSVILDILSGRVWRSALSSWALRWLRDQQRDGLEGRLRRAQNVQSKPLTAATVEILEWERRTRFVPERRASTATTLGDVLVAAGDATNRRFGMRMTSLWEPLRASVARDNLAVAAADEEKAVMSLSGNLAFVLGFYVLEAAIVLALLRHWNDVLMSLLLLPVAYAAYRITVTKAISWTDAVDTVAALHRDELRRQMRLREPREPPTPARSSSGSRTSCRPTRSLDPTRPRRRPRTPRPA